MNLLVRGRAELWRSGFYYVIHEAKMSLSRLPRRMLGGKAAIESSIKV